MQRYRDKKIRVCDKSSIPFFTKFLYLLPESSYSRYKSSVFIPTALGGSYSRYKSSAFRLKLGACVLRKIGIELTTYFIFIKQILTKSGVFMSVKLLNA